MYSIQFISVLPFPDFHEFPRVLVFFKDLLMTTQQTKVTDSKSNAALLQECAADEIAPAITLLFQASINQGNTPSTCRKALVVPIFMKGSKSDASNYRPISLTSGLCKLCEHILHSTILTHLASHKILSDAQHTIGVVVRMSILDTKVAGSNLSINMFSP